MSKDYKSEHVITLKHYLVLCVSAFTAGIFFSVFFNMVIALAFFVVFFFLLSLVSVLLLLVKAQHNPGIKVKKYILLPVILSIFFLLGIARIYYAEQSSAQSLGKYAGDSVWLYGTVSSTPKPTSSGYSYSFEMQLRGVSKNNVSTPMNDKIVIFISKTRAEKLNMFDKINCWTEISYPDSDPYDDIFNYHTHLKGKNIYVIGRTGNTNPCDNLDDIFPLSPTGKAMELIHRCGYAVRSSVTRASNVLFSYNPEANAIINGILTGDKSDFSDELYDSFANAGISHIVAVSGMHLSIFFTALGFIFSSFHMHRKFALVFSLPCIVIFVSTAGFSPSVCRAALMLLLMILAALISERYNSVTALFFALGIILAFTPYSLFAPGLVLSFAATFGILVYFRYLNNIIKASIPFKLLRNLFFNPVAMSLSTFIGTAYFSIFFFERLSWIQVLTNLWVIPLVFIVFCGGYVVCILHYLLPASVVWWLKLPVAGALEIICQTAAIFGKSTFAFNIPSSLISPFITFLFICAAFLIYNIFKNASDSLQSKLMR